MRYNKFSEEARLWIWIPGLLELEIEVHLGRVSFDNLESIQYASVQILSTKRGYDGKKFKLLKGLLNAKSIHISASLDYLSVNVMFELELPNLPVFEKLEILDISGGYLNKDMRPLISFLKLAPNVEQLFLRHVEMLKEYSFQGAIVDEIQCEKLKSVEIVCWKGYEGANRLVKYLLTFLQNIEDVKITRIDRDRIQEYVNA